MKKYARLMRVHHYIKNLLIFFPLIFDEQLLSVSKLIKCTVGFAAFCAVSSVVYIINDIRDKERDCLHPTKALRPIASGAVSVCRAYALAGLLLIAAIACSYFVFDAIAAIILALYLIINLAYSFGLKNIPLVDVSVLVIGYLLRIIYGGVITDIEISNWLSLTVISGSFFFSLGKRRNEILRIGESETRHVNKLYSVAFLDKSMYMCLTMMNVFYSLWSMSNDTSKTGIKKNLFFTVPLMLLISLRYSMVIESASDGDPVEVLFHDKALLILCVLYSVTILALLYLPNILQMIKV